MESATCHTGIGVSATSHPYAKHSRILPELKITHPLDTLIIGPWAVPDLPIGLAG